MTLQDQITELTAKLNNETNIYKQKSIKEKISWAKAELKGNFITKEDLTEYKPLIVSIISKSLYFKGQSFTVAAMKLMIEEINKGRVFRTKKGIKGIVVNMAKMAALDASSNELIRRCGNEVIDCNTAVYHQYYKPFEQFKLKALM